MPTAPSRLSINGTSSDDLLVAHPTPSRLLGGLGNDILIDGPGSDLLEGGGGTNRLFGGIGNDYYRHGIYAEGRQLILDIDPTPGNIDTLIVEESLEEFGPFERYGDDLLIGLQGQPAVITVRQFQRILDYDTTPGNLDTLHIRGPIEPQYVRFYGSERGDLTLELDEQRIVIENYFLNRAFVIEKIRFDDGSVLNETAIRRRLNLAPPPSAQAGAVLQHGDFATPRLAPAEAPVGDSPLGLLLLGATVLSRLGG